MTIAVAIKVNDGLVLAADSASTFTFDSVSPIGTGGNPPSPQIQIYNNANKVFNLVKGLPLGFICCGLGAIGDYSIELLAKDLRARLSGYPDDDYYVNPADYTVQEVTEKLKSFMFDDRYLKHFVDPALTPYLGFLVGGYSANSQLPECIGMEIVQADRTVAVVPVTGSATITALGMPDAIHRLWLGFSFSGTESALKAMQVPDEDVAPFINKIMEHSRAPLVVPGMPLQDAIDLAAFLAELTVNYQRFMPGAKSVGGPIEIAAITKYEGFKWVQRKHYYDESFNPIRGTRHE